MIVPYLFVASRRVYGESGARTATKVLVLIVVTHIVDNTVNLGALYLALWLV